MEIVTGIFDDVIKCKTTLGKDIIRAKKIMGFKKLEKKDIEWIFPYDNNNLDTVSDSKFLYKDKAGNIQEIKSVQELEGKINRLEIYRIPMNEYSSLGKNYIVQSAVGKFYREQEFFCLLIERIEDKINKFSKYVKFNENNLAILTYLSIGELESASIYLKDYYRNRHIPFDNIYLCDSSGLVNVISFK